MKRIHIHVTYNVDHYCPCPWTVHDITVTCTMNQCRTYTKLEILYHTRIKQFINGKLKAKYFGNLCCKLSINVSTCNINMSILHVANIHINLYLVVH